MCEVPGVLTYPAAGTMLVAREPAALPPKPPRLPDRVRDAVRARHDSRRTEEAYVAWTRRYVLFHGKRHPSEMGAPELTQFLSSLAVDGNVARFSACCEVFQAHTATGELDAARTAGRVFGNAGHLTPRRSGR